MIGKRFFLFVFIIALASIALSVLVKPDTKEKAFMHIHDKKFEEAFEYYRRLWAEGNRSVDVITQLADLYLQYGGVSEAISILEIYLKDKPGSYEARERLAVLYQYNQASDKHLKMLESMYKIKPTAPVARNLIHLYSFNGWLDKQSAMLDEYIKKYNADEKDSVDLAVLYSTTGDKEKAIETFEALLSDGQKKKDISKDTLDLYLSLLMQEEQHEKAAKVIAKQGDKTLAKDWALQFQAMGLIAEAEMLLQPFLQKNNEDPDMLLTQAQITDDKNGEPYKKLLELYKNGNMPIEFQDKVFAMIWENGNKDDIDNTLDKTDLPSLSTERLISVAKYCAIEDRAHFANEVRSRLGDEFLQNNGFIDALFLLISGEKNARRRLYGVEFDDYYFTQETFIDLISVLYYGGMQNTAVEMLGEYTRKHRGSNEIYPLIEKYIDFNSEEEGFALLDELRRRHSIKDMANAEQASRQIEYGWALLGSASDRHKEVLAWLQSNDVKDNNLLIDMYYRAREHKHPELALAIAEKLLARDGSPQNKGFVVGALVERGQYNSALKYSEELAETKYFDKSDYFAALSGAIKAGRKNNKLKEKLKKFITDIFPKSNPTPEEKRDLAYFLYDEGYDREATKIFKDLALSMNSHTLSLRNLGEYWRPYIRKKDVPWLWKRLQKTKGERKALWLDLLAEHTDSPKKLLSYFEKNKSLKRNPLLQDAYFTLLRRAEENDVLRHEIKITIARTKDKKGLYKLKDYAQNIDDLSLVAKILLRLHKITPNDRLITRELGITAYYQKQYDKAEKYLETYLQSKTSNKKYQKKVSDDYLAHYFYAELKRKNGEQEPANMHFGKALAAINRSPRASSPELTVKSSILFRLDRTEEALQILRTLMEKQPANKHLRADFANMLIDLGHYNEAHIVLFGKEE